MGLFSFFKKMRSFIKEISDYSKFVKRCEFITGAELAELPDSDLEIAAVSWIQGKFDKDWSNDFEVVSKLPKPCQNIYSCHMVTAEINNGGYNQLFFNSTGRFAKMSVEGFAALGCDNLSKVTAKAIELYGENRLTLEKYDNGTAESFSDSYDEEIFDDLDDEFCCECDDIDYAGYIKANIENFGE